MNKMQAILEAMKTTGARPIEFKTVPQGAATSVWAGLVAPAEAVGGRYCQDCQVAKVSDDVKDAGVRSYALDAQNAKNLWALSEKMVGETF